MSLQKGCNLSIAIFFAMTPFLIVSRGLNSTISSNLFETQSAIYSPPSSTYFLRTLLAFLLAYYNFNLFKTPYSDLDNQKSLSSPMQIMEYAD